MKSLEERWEELKRINPNCSIIVHYNPEHPISIMAQPIIKDEEELFEKVRNLLEEVGESTEFRFVHTCYKRIWSGELTFEEFENELKNKSL